MAVKISTPKGTRDFGPETMEKRNYIFDTIRSVFKLYGYQPIETPAMENMSTLTGKYGEEGDKLLFRILNSGDFLSKLPQGTNTESASGLLPHIAEKGLRYDLTVPFARFVVQHRNDIQFPFKRYQIQTVWRADRPQKGRYREFYQCDADVIGSNALLNEAELIQMADQVFTSLGIKIIIRLNNRKVLAGIVEKTSQAEKLIPFTIALDKLDKIGADKVIAEWKERGFNDEDIEILKPLLEMKGSFAQKIENLHSIIDSKEGKSGLEELKTLNTYLIESGIKSDLELDLTLARGLDYYTGSIIEVGAKDVQMGSICGGGRYDNLTGVFGLEGISGVGISFGADRISDVMEELKLFPASTMASSKVLFINFGEKEEKYCLTLLRKLREAGIASEIFPEKAKMKKQMNYANAKRIPFVILAGEDEMYSGSFSLKNMDEGSQENLSAEEIIDKLK